MLFPNSDVMVNPLLLVLLGVIVGTLGGFFGVGGGFLITGGLLVFGVPPLFAVGTGLTLIMGSSIINMLKHKGMGHVDFKLGLLMVCGTIPAEILAERLNSGLDAAGIAGPVIRYVFIVFLTTLGTFLVYADAHPDQHATTQQEPSKHENDGNPQRENEDRENLVEIDHGRESMAAFNRDAMVAR